MDHRFEKGSKEVLIRIDNSNSEKAEQQAIVLWRTIEEKIGQKEEGETTTLFNLVDDYLKKYAKEHKTTIHFLFSTSNENMKDWFRKNYQDFGFSELRDNEDEGILAADKIYRYSD